MLNESNIPLEEDGIEEEILVDEEITVTKAMWGDIGGNIENQTDLQNALDAKQDQLSEAQLNAVNSGITAEKVTTYDGYADQIASKANQSALNAEATTREQADTALGRRIDDEATARQNADNGLQTQIDAITSKSDVVDVVANYAALQAYDTSSLGNNDVIKVLDDETHEDALTYYRWSTTTQTWSYIGQEAPYYSKGQMDVMLQGKQNKLTAGANIQIENGTISATDTTYTAGNGLNLNGTEFSADTDVLATKEDLEGYYTKSETDNLLAPKLEAEVVAELPTTGEEGKLYLTPKAHTTQTATGNPITATVAEEAGKIESFQLEGDTAQQTYSGINLFSSFIELGYYDTVTGEKQPVSGSSLGCRSASTSKVSPNTQYIFSVNGTAWESGIRVFYYTSDNTFISSDSVPTGIFTTPANCEYINFHSSSLKTDYPELNPLLQIEAGSTASPYQPYTGGQPSPNPDYPQPIQTVTGEQTISINGTDYPLDLGSIELNGLGDDGNGNPLYKDRIYKDGNDWKIHKATGKATLNSSSFGGWALTTGATGYTRANTLDRIGFPAYNGYCDKLTVRTGAHGEYEYIWFQPESTGRIYIQVSTSRLSTSTIEAFNTWLDTVTPTAYYALVTPTDTTITDTALIAQLEAIRTASLENGTNTITNSTPAPNLAGDMEIGYYGYNPRNRYDKWLWLDINNEYEQIGS